MTENEKERNTVTSSRSDAFFSPQKRGGGAQQRVGSRTKISDLRKVSHLKRREPRLRWLQEVGQEVDGTGHTCKCKQNGRFLTPKQKTRTFGGV